MSGLTATGLTTLATILAERHRLFYVSASNALLDATQQDHGCADRSPDGYAQYFWGNRKAQSLYWAIFNRRAANVSTDQAIDELLLAELAVPRSSLIESLTSSLLAPLNNSAFHILLIAPIAERVRRVSLQLPMIPLVKLTKMVHSKDFRTRAIILRVWKVDLISESNRPCYDLVLDDSGFMKIFGGFGDREKEVFTKTEVCTAFIEMYSLIVGGQASVEEFNKTAARCRQVLLRFGPIVQVFPSVFLHPEQAMNLTWSHRHG
ncbi:MAG: hypothetical protein A3E37_05735 [Candidatus Andersenbacteria bacterium RIFCSPHIGHO2_12_FULL_46_9]|nr:MAG: hypothetical protein A3E37_05735 [Candidatus Andersenbacteria bacterium RIFCSPHIGHO2_12_FULL_46_9]